MLTMLEREIVAEYTKTYPSGYGDVYFCDGESENMSATCAARIICDNRAYALKYG